MYFRDIINVKHNILFNFVARDLQSTTAKNIKLLRDVSGLDPWDTGPRKLREAIHGNLSVDIPPLDFWKLIYLRTLLMQLQEAKHCVQEDRMKYLQGLIDSLVI